MLEHVPRAHCMAVYSCLDSLQASNTCKVALLHTVHGVQMHNMLIRMLSFSAGVVYWLPRAFASASVALKMILCPVKPQQICCWLL